LEPGCKLFDLIELPIAEVEMEVLVYFAWIQNEYRGVVQVAISLGKKPLRTKSLTHSKSICANLLY